MDTMTSYNKEFVGKKTIFCLIFFKSFFFNLKAKQGTRAAPIKHDGAIKVSAQFEGNPTYKGKFFKI